MSSSQNQIEHRNLFISNQIKQNVQTNINRIWEEFDPTLKVLDKRNNKNNTLQINKNHITIGNGTITNELTHDLTINPYLYSLGNNEQ